MQVEYGKTFCDLIERGLTRTWQGREVVCENYGIAATGLFEYWHRIVHDVLRPDPPDALVLCIYPGNDFTGEFPAEGFEADGHPRRMYYTRNRPGRDMFYLAESEFAAWPLSSRSASIALWRRLQPPYQVPELWWIDPVLTASAGDAPVISRSRALFQAIEDDCRQCGTKLCVLVVGPVTTYPSIPRTEPAGTDSRRLEGPGTGH